MAAAVARGRACGDACSRSVSSTRLQLYTFMLALRHLDVALAVFLSYMSPIYIALVAPRLLRQRTEPVVVVALALAVSGIVVMLAPGLMDPALRVSTLGVAVGLIVRGAARGLLPGRQDAQRGRRRQHHAHLERRGRGGGHAALRSVPVGRRRLRRSCSRTSGRCWGWPSSAPPSAAPSSCTACATSRCSTPPSSGCWSRRARRCSPSSSSAERPSLWTLLGGVLILVGAVLVVLFGAAEEGLAGSPEEAVGEAGASPGVKPGAAVAPVRPALGGRAWRWTCWRPRATRRTPSRARARDAKARRIRYALAAGSGASSRSGRCRLGREPGVTILLIYSRLWPDPG